MKSLGSMVERLSGDKGSPARHNSVLNIIQKIVLKKQKIVLDIQKEMVDDKKELGETSAGQELETEILKERAKHAKDLKLIQAQTKLADEKTKSLLEEHEKAYQRKLDKLDEDKGNLNVSIAEMYKQKEQQSREINDLKVEQMRQSAQLQKDMERRKGEFEQQYQSQLEAFEKERSEMKATTKAQQESALKREAGMAKKLQKLEDDYAREIKQMQAKVKQSDSSSSSSLLGSLIVPLIMLTAVSGMTGGMGLIPGLGS